MERKKIAFLTSLGLHILLLGFLVFNVDWSSPKHPVSEAADHSPEPIHAVTLNQEKLEQQIRTIKAEEKQKKREEETRLKRLEDQAKQASAKASEEKKRLAELAEKRRKQEAEQQEQSLKAKQQLEKTQREQATEKARLEKLKTQRQEEEMERQLRLEEAELLTKQMQAEQQALAAAHSRQNQSEMDKYTALITHAIGRHWIRPDHITEDISCVLFIRLSPHGDVLDVSLVTSSGDALLDRSAIAAVRKASPLPLPEDPELFTKFREIRLKVKPEGYLL